MNSQVRTRLRVLVADDEHLIADTLARILSDHGFEASAVYSGAEAVELVDGWQPNVFLSDVIMPGITGIEAAIRIRARIPNCRVLLLSGQAATSNLLKEGSARGHAFEILLKPIHPAELLKRLRAICRESGLAARDDAA